MKYLFAVTHLVIDNLHIITNHLILRDVSASHESLIQKPSLESALSSFPMNMEYLLTLCLVRINMTTLHFMEHLARLKLPRIAIPRLSGASTNQHKFIYLIGVPLSYVYLLGLSSQTQSCPRGNNEEAMWIWNRIRVFFLK